MATKNIPLKNSKGVLYCSPKGSSEYSEIGKRIVYSFLQQSITVSWYQFDLDSTKNDETDFVYQTAKKCLNKNISFDTVVFQCNPDVWYKHIEKFKIKFLKKKLIGFPIWETNKVPELWVKYMNLLDEIWVASDFNKSVFEKCGVSVPIKVVSVPFINKPLPDINADSLTSLLMKSKWYGNESKLFRYGEDWKIYYTIGEWDDRNNIEEAVTAFCKTFNSEDCVKLIIKTFCQDYSNKNVNYCVSSLERILSKFKQHPEILLITSELSDQENLLLHSIGDCFYSMTRGEGFGINIFDAHNYKKKIIAPKFGGHVEYVEDGGLIDCDLVGVSFKEKESTYSGDQKWSDSDLNDASDKLKEAYLKNVKKDFNSPVLLNRGWYFKERKDGKSFRQTSSTANISLRNPSLDYVKLKFRYDFGVDSKELGILIDSTIKQTYKLSRGVSFDIVIPTNGVKNIEVSSVCDVPEKHNSALWDHRNIGVVLEQISFIKENYTTSLDIDDIPVENELTDFYFLSVDRKIAEELKNEEVYIGDKKSNKVNLVNVEVGNNSEFCGITYFGQYGTCGYASAAKGNLVHFFTKGIPVSWIPLYFDNSELSDECFYNAMVKSLIKKPISSYDTVFLHSTPDTWKGLKTDNAKIVKGRKIIGYTVWESSQLPVDWVESINENVDEVWCPSTYNESVFKYSGVKTPIRVFPHVFLQKELPSRESVVLRSVINDSPIKESKLYTFYNISELNPRKGVEDLVKVFCEAFNSRDKVRLILKLHHKNYEERNKRFCINKLNEIVSQYKNPPKIHYVLNNLSEIEILGLHSIGDCYVSLCKSEGFGLTIFEAFKYGRQIITTGYGGQVDFLGKDYEGLVQYKMGNITEMKGFSKYYTENQQWAYPVLDHARDLMIMATK